MRHVTLTDDQFNHFVFPVWANAQSPGDPELVIRITRKLKNVSEEEPLSPAQKRAVEEGQRVYSPRRASTVEINLVLEEDEHRALRDVFKKALPNFNVMAMEEAYEISELLDNAPSADQAEPAEG